MNMMLKIINNKIYNAGKDCILVSNMKAKLLEIAKNDILKNKGSGIRLSNVRSTSDSSANAIIRNNVIAETYIGYGI